MRLNLQIDKEFKGLYIHLVQGNILWASRAYTLYRSFNYGNTWEKVIDIPAKPLRFAASHINILSRLLRTGIHNVMSLPFGNLLIISDGKIYKLSTQKKDLKEVHKLRIGRRPLRNAFCINKQNTIYYGEYWPNPKRKEIRIYKSSDYGESWQPVYSFPENTIRHIHALQYDPFSGWLWVTTGDLDPECKIGYSEDGGKNFHIIGSGSEIWRTMTLIFTQDYIYWGTDGERGQNYICRWKRPEGPVEKIKSVDGPIYYSTILREGIILVGTGVENAPSEWDNFARLWASADGANWVELSKWEKDLFPPHVFKHGTIYFANGQDDKGYFYYTLVALKDIDGSSFRAKIKVFD